MAKLNSDKEDKIFECNSNEGQGMKELQKNKTDPWRFKVHFHLALLQKHLTQTERRECPRTMPMNYCI